MTGDSLPPDRGEVLTEGVNPASAGMHALSVRGLVDLFADENRRVDEAVRAASGSIAAFIEAAEAGFVAGGRLVYLGAGTSGRLGVLDASEAPPTFDVPEGRVVGLIAGGDGALRRSSESKEDEPEGARAELERLGLTERDAVLGIAAGGTTPYVVGGLALAKDLAPGCVTGMLSCSPIERPAGADHLIVVATGPELLTGSTRLKAGTATKVVLNTISTALMVRAGRVYGNLMVDLRATNDKLRDRAARLITMLTGLGRAEAFVLLGRAGGEVKVAVVMERRGVDAEGARRMLADAGGRLEGVIG